MSDLDRPPAARASAADRACFARVAHANAVLEDAGPPASLRETLARVEALRAMLNESATNAGERVDEDEDDLEGRLAYLMRMRGARPAAAQAAPPVDAANWPPTENTW